MTDLHTHILPGIDDGAKSIEEALALLRAQANQGVDTVALTPHFYKRRNDAADFLARREVAWRQLLEATKDIECPNLLLGAEVAWVSGMTQWPELEALCYQGTKILLVELPMIPWTDSIFRELYSLEARRGVTPMIAHLDRYLHLQKKRDIEKLLEMGYPVQVSAEALSHFYLRKQALEWLEKYDGLLISDCHNLDDRAPNLSNAMKIIEKKLGGRIAGRIAAVTDEVLDD
jgi:protein-tyrosine phosphatase